MKGCMIDTKEREISIVKDIFQQLSNVGEYHWLITNIECWPQNEKIKEAFYGEYCWISGKDLLQFLNTEEFMWVWGVFSGFPENTKLEEVLNYDMPYADGYKGFWKNPVSIQHPLAELEIVAWDGRLLLVISKDENIIETIKKKEVSAQDLEKYNLEG